MGQEGGWEMAPKQQSSLLRCGLSLSISFWNLATVLKAEAEDLVKKDKQ
jgi:hypothetical protein